jgi:hypothetical protein
MGCRHGRPPPGWPPLASARRWASAGPDALPEKTTTHRSGRGWRRICLRDALAGLLAAALAAPLPLLAQQPVAPRSFGPEELEQIAAPIALYPDALLAQVLMAATYPLEVVMAARFVQANPGLAGPALNEALTTQNWDDSVKSLVAFPQVLGMMNEQLAWTQKLGDASLAQREELMDAIQRLRARAQAEGTLATTPQQVVTVEPGPAPGPPIIGIEPAAPDVVYVPTYDPLVVYGPWPYPLYPPYYYYYPPGWILGGFFTFGVGIVLGTALWGRCDWHHHRIDLDVGRYQTFTRIVNVDRNRSELIRGRLIPGGERLTWEHSPEHRRGVLYRTEGLQHLFGRPGAPDPAAREMFRGREDAGPQPGRAPGADVRPGPQPGRAPGPEIRPGPAPRPERGPGAAAPSRPFIPGVTPPREPGAFQGLGRGPDTRSYSERGRESRRSIAPPPSSGARPSPSRPAPSRPAPSGPSHRPAPGGGGRR